MNSMNHIAQPSLYAWNDTFGSNDSTSEPPFAYF